MDRKEGRTTTVLERQMDLTIVCQRERDRDINLYRENRKRKRPGKHTQQAFKKIEQICIQHYTRLEVRLDG